MKLFGTVNRVIPSNRQRHSFRVAGGVSSPKIPQVGSFEALRNLIQAERARELRVGLSSVNSFSFCSFFFKELSIIVFEYLKHKIKKDTINYINLLNSLIKINCKVYFEQFNFINNNIREIFFGEKCLKN